VKEAEASRLRVNAEQRRAESQYERLKRTAAVISGEAVLAEGGRPARSMSSAVGPSGTGGSARNGAW
jgi:hypothetical protein